ncbi:hypothetical protein M404DRAFT_611994 [Pisolithus tinctorius Marx 270]|uniref:Uncharacterized protein n=1 Tax=Pisolithus tinctorius Marx 270 TaxID=870435 RepID=A0A0C3K254_PISTI|nr:hypothetical protein M404DRAFT_611994 [Pisolithus tinctorius Marx 270]
MYLILFVGMVMRDSRTGQRVFGIFNVHLSASPGFRSPRFHLSAPCLLTCLALTSTWNQFGHILMVRKPRSSTATVSMFPQ